MPTVKTTRLFFFLGIGYLVFFKRFIEFDGWPWEPDFWNYPENLGLMFLGLVLPITAIPWIWWLLKEGYFMVRPWFKRKMAITRIQELQQLKTLGVLTEAEYQDKLQQYKSDI